MPSHPTSRRRHPPRFLPALLWAALAGLATPSATAAPWYGFLKLASGDEILLNKQGLALRPSGSRAEIDVPVRVRFAAPVASPVGPVHVAGAKVIIQCDGRKVTAGNVVPRTTQDQAFATKSRAAAAEAATAAFNRALSDPAFLDQICRA